MLAVQGNDALETQIPPAYETAFSALQSKKKGIRRIRFKDSDNNAADAEAADFSATDVSAIFPRSLASGRWGDEFTPVDERTSMLGEIEAVRKTLPKFYETYCTPETASALSGILGEIDEAVGNDADVETLAGLKSRLEEAAGKVAFKHDSKIAQVYVATKKNESGDSYGTDPSTGLKKADDYVPAQMVVVGTDGKIMAQDLSWSGQIKVRGNTTAGQAKRPYTMKFNKKVGLFGFAKSKKWVLLADALDPTLMRNKIALDLGEEIGLETTSGHQRVEVWVDGDYRGMYLLTEKIEADTVDIDAKHGDFMFEFVADWQVKEDEVSFVITAGGISRTVILHEPEKEESADVVKTILANFENTLRSGSWDRVAASIDVESMASFYVVNEFMRTTDFVVASAWFYYKDGKIYGGPAWDFDGSSGNRRDSPKGIYIANAHFYRHLSKYPEFQLAVSERVARISDTLCEMYADNTGWIDSDTGYYDEAIARNNEVWDPSRDVTFLYTDGIVNATYEDHVSFLKNWLASRYDWMTDYFLARTYISSDTFPDSALREYVKTFDTDSDSFLSTAEKSAVTSINLSKHGLTFLNLAGLEVFPKLVSLDVTGNPGLTWLNIAKFPGLNVEYDYGLTLIDALPRFSGHSLVLSGQIGVDFYVEIPDGTDTRGAYAEFTINGKTGNPAMLSNAEHQGGNEYMFTCYINSIQMAESITATFHYGSDESITEEYRAKDYLDAVTDGEGYSDELVNLVKAIKDFGHYVQPPLAHNNGWEIGVDYAEMDCADPEIDADSADVKGKLSDFAIVDESKGSGIRLVEMDLELNSETTINVYLNVSADYSGNVGAYLGDSGENMAVKQNDGTYRITISGISAHMLGDVYTIHVDAGGKFDIEVSALSYANAVMNSKRAEDELKKAVIALYKYYDATMEYRKSKPEEYGNN